jgi:putative oxidoreductase
MTTNPRTKWLADRRASVLARLDRLRWLAPLMGRLAVGLLFLSTGWGKVQDTSKVTQFFESLGVPAPGFNAVLVSYSELVCGSLLVVGLFTRLATIPLAISMVVAILTAKRSSLHGLFDLVGFDEFTYLVVLLIIALIGPGEVSLDRILIRKMVWRPKLESS